MASSFDLWEKDPFFPAAEEVQDSADRMESTYQRWVHAKADASNVWNLDELQRDLCTALGTTKWQLEAFEGAVKSSYVSVSSDESRNRHHDFIVATAEHISKINNSLKESGHSDGKAQQSSWVRLDEGECDELALFLSRPLPTKGSTGLPKCVRDHENHQDTEEESVRDFSKSSCPLSEMNSLDTIGKGHRRTASANVDIDAWKISVVDSGHQQNSSNGHPPIPPRKIPSLSSFLNSMDSTSKMNWSKNGYRKVRGADSHHESDSELPRSCQLDKDGGACCERSKSCLANYDDCYDKQLYGWYGSLHRQLQRSQYQMQYSRPVQMAFSAAILICLFVLIALRAF